MTAPMVVGIGDGGCRALHYISTQRLRSLHTLAINTHSADLERADARTRLLIGEGVTHGQGAGGDADLGWRSAIGSQDLIDEALAAARVVYLLAAFGGGTGTGATPVIAEIARGKGARVIAVVSLPFMFEGESRRTIAEQAVHLLRPHTESLHVIDAERLLRFVSHPPSLIQVYGLLAGALAWQTLARVVTD